MEWARLSCDTGVVDEDIGPVERGLDLFSHCFDGRAAGYIAFDYGRLFKGFVGRFPSGVFFGKAF